MRFPLHLGGLGTRLARPVAGYYAYNGSSYTDGTNSNTSMVMDTIVRDDGPIHSTSANFNPVVGGWWLTFGSMTHTNWGNSSTYRQLYILQTNAVLPASKHTSMLESYHAGSLEHSLCNCNLMQLSAPGGASNKGIHNQVSGSTRTVPAQGDRISTARINDITARGASIYRTSGLTHTAGVELTMTFQAEHYDDADFYDPATPTRMTVPTGMDGWYMITGGACWGSSSNERRATIRLNGTTRIATQNTNASGGTKSCHVFALHYLVAGDYIELLNLSGTTIATVNTNSPYGHLTMMRIAKGDYAGACVSRTTTQSVAQNANDAITFDSAVKDTWGMSDIGGSNPTRLTIPADQGGWYAMVGNMRWTASAEGQRRAGIYVNGATQWEARHSLICNTNQTDDPGLPVGMIKYLSPGDYVELKAENISSIQANTTQADQVFLSVVRIDQ